MAWGLPVAGATVSQWWGVANSRYSAGYHTGVDFAGKTGSKIMSVTDGTVIEAGYNKSYGNYAKVKHSDGTYGFYAHMQTLTVSKGVVLKQGSQVGTLGNSGNSTGPHLHFEVRGAGGGYYDTVDPRKYLNIGGGGSGGAASAPSRSTSTSTSSAPAKEAAVADKPMTAQDFGFAASFLAANPELQNIINEAISAEWTNAQVQGRVIDSAWYKARTDKQREYDQGTLSDAKTWAEKERVMLDEMTRLASIMGVPTTGLAGEAKNAVRNGLSAQDSVGFLATRANYSREQVNRSGLVQQRLIEYGDMYGVSMSPDEITRNMREVLSKGPNWEESLSSTEDVFRERAKTMYAGVADQIDKGATVKDILDPYLGRASEMLGVPKTQMGTSSAMWNRAVTGAVPMTLQEWDQTVRKDPTYRWDNGPQAMDWARQTGDEFMKAFGARS